VAVNPLADALKRSRSPLSSPVAARPTAAPLSSDSQQQRFIGGHVGGAAGLHVSDAAAVREVLRRPRSAAAAALALPRQCLTTLVLGSVDAASALAAEDVASLLQTVSPAARRAFATVQAAGGASRPVLERVFREHSAAVAWRHVLPCAGGFRGRSAADRGDGSGSKEGGREGRIFVRSLRQQQQQQATDWTRQVSLPRFAITATGDAASLGDRVEVELSFTNSAAVQKPRAPLPLVPSRRTLSARVLQESPAT